MEAAVLHAKYLVDELQQEANRRRGHSAASQEAADGRGSVNAADAPAAASTAPPPPLGSVIKSLLALHHLLQSHLAAYHDATAAAGSAAAADAAGEAQGAKLAVGLRRWLSHRATEEALPAATRQLTPLQAAERLAEARKTALDAELAVIPAAAALAGASERGDALQSVVTHLRASEQSVAFQAALAAAVRDATDRADSDSDGEGEGEGKEGGGGYSAENFAYGSTSYASWMAVAAADGVGPAVAAAMAGSSGSGSGGRRTFMVWGSSAGWIAFYGALSYGWHVVGYELLPPLVSTANACAAAHGLLADDQIASTSSASAVNGAADASGGGASSAAAGTGAGDTGTGTGAGAAASSASAVTCSSSTAGAAARAAGGAGAARTGAAGAAASAHGGTVRFIAGDLLASRLDDVGFLQLTDQCWDAALVARAHDKIAAQLPTGAVVCDYTGAAERLPCLRLLAAVPVAVSWNARQVMRAYVKLDS